MHNCRFKVLPQYIGLNVDYFFAGDTDTEYSSERPDTTLDEGDQRSAACSLNNSAIITTNNDAELQQEPTNDTLEALFGLTSINTQEKGTVISTDLATRWESYLSSGLDKEGRKKLTEKWMAPSNCKYLKRPELNPEVKALINPADLKKDKLLLNLQTVIGKAVTAQITALAKILQKKDSIDPLISQALVDSGKLRTDVIQTIYIHRRYKINKYLREPVQKIAWQQKQDTLLLGADFSEKSKTAKAIETAAQELAKRKEQQEPTSSHLNYQRPTYKTRLKNSSFGREKEKKGRRTSTASQITTSVQRQGQRRKNEKDNANTRRL